MNRLHRLAPYRTNPYHTLYIYYIQGCPASQEDLSGDDFIGVWEEDGFSFLFFLSPSDQKVETLLHRQPHLTLLDRYEMSYEQWQGDVIGPVRTGGFFITPPWDKAAYVEHDRLIILDPGVVFGSGLHPTTKDCLNAIETVCAEETVSVALDLGTGTGLLALAAARLGCEKVLAVDVNHLAVQTAGQNIRLNILEDQILAVRGRAEEMAAFPCDLFIANIHYDIMKEIIRPSWYEGKTFFILSGLLRSEAEKIRTRLARQPVNIIKTWVDENGWHTCLGRVLSRSCRNAESTGKNLLFSRDKTA